MPSLLFVDHAPGRAGKNHPDRKQIRSHVMQGKNAGKVILRGRKNATKEQQPRRPTTPPFSPDPAALAWNSSPSTGSPPAAYKVDVSRDLVLDAGNPFSTVRFPAHLDAFTGARILAYMTVLADAMYPLKFCLPYDPSKSVWFQYVATDEAFFHCTIAMASTMMHQLAGPGYSHDQHREAFHLSRCFGLTNRALAAAGRGAAPLADSTLGLVATLLIYEVFGGDRSRSTVHFDGMQRMVEMRGGFAELERKPALLQKVCRADIEYSLRFQTQPRYFRTVAWPAVFSAMAHDPAVDECTAVLARALSRLEEDAADPLPPAFLAAVLDIKAVTEYLNGALERRTRFGPLVYQEIWISLHYRLLHVPAPEFVSGAGDGGVGVHATARAALFAFSTSTLLQSGWRAEQYRHLGDGLRVGVQCSDGVWRYPRLVLWMLVVGGMTVFANDADRAWMAAAYARLSAYLDLRSWDAVRETLKIFPWIDVLHDRPAKEFWERLERGQIY